MITGLLVDLLTAIVDLLTAILDFFSTFFEALLNLLKDLFIPKDGELDKEIQEIQMCFYDKFNMTSIDIESTINQAISQDTELNDVMLNYKVVDNYLTISNVKIIDYQYLDRALMTFRPILRGLVVLLMMLYNINQFLVMIGQAPISLLYHIGNNNGSKEQDR